MFHAETDFFEINGSEICFQNDRCSHWDKQRNTIDYGHFNG